MTERRSQYSLLYGPSGTRFLEIVPHVPIHVIAEQGRIMHIFGTGGELTDPRFEWWMVIQQIQLLVLYPTCVQQIQCQHDGG